MTIDDIPVKFGLIDITIPCKYRCSSPDCRGCNVYQLQIALRLGYFNVLMNDNRFLTLEALESIQTIMEKNNGND